MHPHTKTKIQKKNAPCKKVGSEEVGQRWKQDSLSCRWALREKNVCTYDSQAVYGIPEASTDGVGKVGYVTDDAQMREYPDSMTKANSVFYDMGAFNSPGDNTTQTLNDVNEEDCKSACKEQDSCAGYAYRGSSKGLSICNLKDDGIFPKGPRVPSKNWTLKLRGKSVTNGPSCPTQVVEGTGETWNAYPKADGMTMDTLCNLGFMTEAEKQKFDAAAKELDEIAQEIQKELASLTETDEKLVESMGYNIKKLKRDLKRYPVIKKEGIAMREKLNNASAMESDAQLNMVSHNSKYLLWSILAIVLVTASIRTTRK